MFFQFQITYVEQPLKDPTRALGTYGVKDGDVVVLRQADRRPPPTQPAFPGNTGVCQNYMKAFDCSPLPSSSTMSLRWT